MKKPAKKATKAAQKAKKPVAKAKSSTKKVQETKLVKPSVRNNGLVAETPNTNGIDEWTVRDAARVIAEAEQHKKNPKLMKAVKAHVQNLANAVGGLK
jgi:hypothetical protein